jgi:tetratricopeptide (TPR) repeat protein
LASVYQADVPVALRLDLVYALAPVVERAGAWTVWAATLESLRDALSGSDSLWCGLHLGTARRWLSQWPEAAYVLSDVMQQAGQAGEFALQADAMVELAAVYRFQEQYQLAEQLLDRAQHFYQRHALADGIERITADRIQMALDADDIPAAQRHLREIDRRIRPPSPRLLSLAAMVALRADDLDTALELAQLARQALSDDKSQLARVVAQLGQIYYRRGESTSAINHLSSALAMMEQHHDLLGHARTRMNLAAVYLGHGNLRTALRYLRDLPADLERLGDASTLRAALKNLDILNSVARHWVRPGG